MPDLPTAVSIHIYNFSAKHEEIASEEKKDIQRDSAYFGDIYVLPKGHVPTHTVNYNDFVEPEITLTNDPPSVTGLPTVIVPASSELPDEELAFSISQVCRCYISIFFFFFFFEVYIMFI